MKHILSIFIAFILAKCIVSYLKRDVPHGPNSSNVKKQIFKTDNKCYKFKAITHICPLGKSIK